jgi:hypothetical protein
MESFKTVKQRCHKKLRDLLDAVYREGETHGVSRDIDMSKAFESCTNKLIQLYVSYVTLKKQFKKPSRLSSILFSSQCERK